MMKQLLSFVVGVGISSALWWGLVVPGTSPGLRQFVAILAITAFVCIAARWCVEHYHE